MLPTGTFAIDRPALGVAVATATGSLDVYSAGDARTALIGLINEARYRQVIDLSGVDFIDSTGLAVIVGAWKRARAHGGTLTLVVTPGSHVEKALQITGLHKTIEAHDTVTEVLAALGADAKAGA